MRDSERPPVLAQQRYAAARQKFGGMNLAERFAYIHNNNLWGASRSVSGLGSEPEATSALITDLPIILAKLGVKTMLDAPCGDAKWITSIDLGGIRYVGVDIVAELIAANIVRSGTLGSFLVRDITRDPLPAADAVLCRDCLVHLSFDNIARAVANLSTSGARWLIATTFPELERNQDCEDGDWRALNFENAPFCWPAPIELLNEQCVEGGGGWRDKSLGVWEIHQLPKG